MLLLLLSLLPLHGWAGQAAPVASAQAQPVVALLEGLDRHAGACSAAQEAAAQEAAAMEALAGLSLPAQADGSGQPQAAGDPSSGFPSPDPLLGEGADTAPTGADLAEQLLPSRTLALGAQAARAAAPPYAGAALPDPLLPRLPRPPRV
ncbi:hypothetical protein [Cupriavidus sp. AU9028]|uniref:hypothetical protein n=1 Tax=Cupriavidus sp. AU9028 TaxID=2871157 RepID=UPI00210326A5|nr:hypothetical protein [Cupriavidus sp. AU9028]